MTDRIVIWGEKGKSYTQNFLVKCWAFFQSRELTYISRPQTHIIRIPPLDYGCGKTLLKCIFSLGLETEMYSHHYSFIPPYGDGILSGQRLGIRTCTFQ